VTFKDLNLPPLLLSSLEKLSFVNPTPIQEQAIPGALAGRDLIGLAQTGTGKTAAFCLPMIARLLENSGQTAVVLAPTRELAMQILEFVRALTRGIAQMESVLLIGGVSMGSQLQALRRRPRILVATPGRLVDHLRHKSVSLQNVGILVLDEADAMLDMGFAQQLNVILGHLPKRRQTLLFSATFPKEIEALAGRYLNDPIRIKIGEISKPVEKISQSVIQTTAQKKNDILLDELNGSTGSVLIFVRTKHRTNRLFEHLESYGYEVARIHGNRSQAQRTASLNGFRSGEFRILVATDIAARGIDVTKIKTVINYDLPDAPEDYIHRIGRTARNGSDGRALCLITPEDKNKWAAITRHIDKLEGRTPTPNHNRQQPAKRKKNNHWRQHKKFGKFNRRSDRPSAS
jgi:superfamily II DNA/RNA helicase